MQTSSGCVGCTAARPTTAWPASSARRPVEPVQSQPERPAGAVNPPGRFLIVTWDGGGNTPPALNLAERRSASGHHVRILGWESMAARAAGDRRRVHDLPLGASRGRRARRWTTLGGPRRAHAAGIGHAGRHRRRSRADATRRDRRRLHDGRWPRRGPSARAARRGARPPAVRGLRVRVARRRRPTTRCSACSTTSTPCWRWCHPASTRRAPCRRTRATSVRSTPHRRDRHSIRSTPSCWPSPGTRGCCSRSARRCRARPRALPTMLEAVAHAAVCGCS